MKRCCWALSAVVAALFVEAVAGGQTLILPRMGVDASELAVVVNANFTNSSAIAAEFAAQRGIPAEHIFTLALGAAQSVSGAVFSAERERLLAMIGADRGWLQGFVLAFSWPYFVDSCESITSAFALGFNKTLYCKSGTSVCGSTAPVAYYNSWSTHPWDTHRVLPAIVITGHSREEAARFIAAGVAADGTHPTGLTGWLVRTTDTARSVRYYDFQTVSRNWLMNTSVVPEYVEYPSGNAIFNKTSMAFYFQSLASVPGITTNTYAPGAVCDHLTSYGGKLYVYSQMPATRWIEAGCTASFGTVTEPCNYQTKFPRVSVFLQHYMRGEPLLNAYWKSVNWPGEGIFVGEPLASPYASAVDVSGGGSASFKTTVLVPGYNYTLQCATSPTTFEDISKNHRAADSAGFWPSYYTVSAAASSCPSGCWRLYGGPCVVNECNGSVACANSRCFKPASLLCSFESTSSSSSSLPKRGNGGAIAAAIIVPLLVVAGLIAAGIVFFRRNPEQAKRISDRMSQLRERLTTRGAEAEGSAVQNSIIQREDEEEATQANTRSLVVVDEK